MHQEIVRLLQKAHSSSLDLIYDKDARIIIEKRIQFYQDFSLFKNHPCMFGAAIPQLHMLCAFSVLRFCLGERTCFKRFAYRR
jgi:hypothetical protein